MTTKYSVAFLAAILGLGVSTPQAEAQVRYYFRGAPPVYRVPMRIAPMGGSTPMIVNGGRPSFYPGYVVQHYIQNYSPVNTAVMDGSRAAWSYGAAMDGAMGASRFLAPNPYWGAAQILLVPNVAY